jgi:signal transduction histidine kinase
MDWDIDSTQISNRRLNRLRNRLLFSYLLIITAVLGTFSAYIYILVAHDRQQQLNSHLYQVSTSAVGTLEIIQHEYEELTTEDEYKGYVPTEPDGTPVPIALVQLMGKYKAEPVSQVVASPLTAAHQGVEWYDKYRRLMVREGGLFPQTPLPLTIPRQGINLQQSNSRSFIQPAYLVSTTHSNQITGYVRVTESTVTLEAELERLQWSLIFGVAIVSSLAAVGGIWLTRESLKPIIQSLNQLKQFTSDASHELRNPLTAIRASLAVMQSHLERVHPADIDKLTSMATASAQMSRLVDDLLLLARMDRQAPDQSGWRRIDLDELLEDLVDLYGDRAQEFQIALKLQSVSNLEINGDASQLQQLFTNLLTNALQYTTSGGTVIVSVQRAGMYVLVNFQDTGIGIDSEQTRYIFDRFWRADQARNRYEEGSGLGLAIARSVAQRHRGDITVQSKLGEGSCFQVKIPLA